MIDYHFKAAKDAGTALSQLYEIISMLRSPDGCPYDRAQTEKSSAGNLIDEVYEYLDGVNKDDMASCREEIGDVLLNVISILQIHQDKKDFSCVDAVNEVCEKLIRRHPHVFSDKSVESVEEGLSLWNSVKEEEKGHRSSIEEVIGHIPSGMPPLEKSFEIQKKLGRMGFEWNNIDEVIDKVYEELDEVKDAIHEGSQEHIEDELGDVFLTIVNLARWLRVRPDQALARANRKITSRFARLSQLASERGIAVDHEHMEELDRLWEEVKEGEN